MAKLRQQDGVDKFGSLYFKEQPDNYEDQFNTLKNQAQATTATADQANSMTDTKPLISKEFSQGAERGMSGGLGSMVMSGGLASGNPYAMAGGLGLMALEGDAQAKQAEEKAKAEEAMIRKQNQLAAINQLISVSKGLGV